MLRYLRARKFKPQDALGQFKDTEDWRKQNELDQLYETIDVDEYEQARRLYPQWTGRMDKRGIPLYVFEVANLSTKDINAHQNDDDRKKEKKAKKGDKVDIKAKSPRKMLRLFALYENLCRFVLPLCSAVPNRQATETPVSQSANIVDLSKVGLKQFWALRAHLQDSSALATAHYPETLDRIFVIGAPSFFNTVWDWAKGWFDPITVSKVYVLNEKTMLSELSKVVDVENIPKKYGGKLDWNFGDMPFLGPNVTEALRWKEVVEEKGHKTLPKGPIRWEYDADGDLVAIAIGSEGGKLRKRVLAGFHPDADVATLALSPGRQHLNPANSALFATLSHQGRKASHSAESTAANGSANKHLDTTDNTDTTNVMSADNVNPQTTEASAMPLANGTSSVPTNGLDKSSEPVASQSINGDNTEAFTVPYRDTQHDIAHPPEDSRQGTSSTRMEQQEGTHAEGQLENGTPQIRIDGQGTNHSVMEPRTVGQAPKETAITREEEPQPTIVEQVQDYAGQAQAAVVSAVGSVAGVVGLGGAQAQAEEKSKEIAEQDTHTTSTEIDRSLDNMDQAQIEEFLRAKNSSVPEKLNGEKVQSTTS